MIYISRVSDFARLQPLNVRSLLRTAPFQSNLKADPGRRSTPSLWAALDRRLVFAWNPSERRLLVRWECHQANILSFVPLAALCILLKQFLDGFWCRVL